MRSLVYVWWCFIIVLGIALYVVDTIATDPESRNTPGIKGATSLRPFATDGPTNTPDSSLLTAMLTPAPTETRTPTATESPTLTSSEINATKEYWDGIVRATGTAVMQLLTARGVSYQDARMCLSEFRAHLSNCVEDYLRTPIPPDNTSNIRCAYANRNSNLRAGPGTNYAVIGSAPKSSCVPISGRNRTGTWYVFQDADVFGYGVNVWISAELVDNAPSELPVVAASSTPVPPRQPAVACNIKGNVQFDTGERIYHVPGDEYYDETEINPAFGERWFCSETEARAAGWRRSYR